MAENEPRENTSPTASDGPIPESSEELREYSDKLKKQAEILMESDRKIIELRKTLSKDEKKNLVLLEWGKIEEKDLTEKAISVRDEIKKIQEEARQKIKEIRSGAGNEPKEGINPTTPEGPMAESPEDLKKSLDIIHNKQGSKPDDRDNTTGKARGEDVKTAEEIDKLKEDIDESFDNFDVSPTSDDQVLKEGEDYWIEPEDEATDAEKPPKADVAEEEEEEEDGYSKKSGKRGWRPLYNIGKAEYKIGKYGAVKPIKWMAKRGFGYGTSIFGAVAYFLSKNLWKILKLETKVLWKSAKGEKTPSFGEIWREFFPKKDNKK